MLKHKDDELIYDICKKLGIEVVDKPRASTFCGNPLTEKIISRIFSVGNHENADQVTLIIKEFRFVSATQHKNNWKNEKFNIHSVKSSNSFSFALNKASDCAA